MTEQPKEKEMVFYPNFLFREAIAALLVTALVVALAFMHPMKVGDPADPSDSAFKPRPEWYFMAPFYLLKVFPASLEIVPTVLLPLVLFIVILTFPFFDTNPERNPAKRPAAMLIMALCVAAVVALTILGLSA
jgi:ubiquinol-cytochrome c reductase cytochrome b subunit